MKKERKLKTSTKILFIVCFLGLIAMLYPAIANYYNENFTAKAVTQYVETVKGLSSEDYKLLWDEARQYNKDIYESGMGFKLRTEFADRYKACLNSEGDGMMGYLDIPKMKTTLAVYHTTNDTVLSSNVGHLEWSSLPVGGKNTHCCLSAHRGLAKAKLFTDLDILREGDTFSLNILNEILTYEVDQIRTVEPTDMQALRIEEGKDYCTLITCTPYGINTHRLLVRGHRIETVNYVRVVSEAVIIDPMIVAPIVAFPLLFILVMMVILKKPEPQPDAQNKKSNSISKSGGSDI